ncbi:hypothetical protein [Epilithonimonas sp. UC225_85]|uniref:hypothetical protein n=1 Tax=Epilithonimonas sp. UC225_85 TaxID=3350167 RepID=UPI0036D29874
MKKYLAKFFLKAKDEDGNIINLSNIEDGFAGFIYFTEENFIDCTIKIDDVIVFESYLDREQEYMFDAFSEFVQSKMRDSQSTYNDIQETNQSLMYAL